MKKRGDCLSVAPVSRIEWRRFFRSRIDFEEELLASNDFFGAKYTEYKRVTPTFIPLIQ